MREINFITSNKGKVEALKAALLEKKLKIDVRIGNLGLIEPQFDQVKEVSRYKAERAFAQLRQPVLVEDGGFCVEALDGFPGVYTHYVLQTIGAKGILKLLAGETNRRAHFVSCATFVDEDGVLYQFEREASPEMEIGEEMMDIASPYAWSDLWKIIYLKRYGKYLCQMTAEELAGFRGKRRGSIPLFVDWLAQRPR